MDFSDALRHLRAGETVRRQAWAALARVDPDEYATLDLTVPAPGFERVFVITTAAGRRTMFNPSHAQLLAEDWELA